MKILTKRMLCIIICLLIVISNMQITFAEDDSFTENVDLFTDYETSLNPFDSSGACFSTEKYNEGHALSFKTRNSGDGFVGKFFKLGFKKSIYQLSFNYYQGCESSRVDVRLFNGKSGGITDNGNCYTFAQFTSKKFLQIFRRASWMYDKNLDYAYSAKTDYNINVFIDTINEELTMFVNNDKVAQMPLDENYVDLHGFAIRLYQGSEETYSYIDNLKLCEVKDLSGSLLSPVYINYKTDENVFANNFTNDYPVCFDVTLKNRDLKNLNLKYYYKTYKRNGETIETTENSPIELSLNSNEEKTITIKPQIKYYGRHSLDFVYEINGVKYTKKIEYCFINQNESNPNNKSFGINTGRGNFDNHIKLVNTAKIGSIRINENYWAQSEKQKGVINFPTELDRRFNVIKDSDIFLLSLFANGNNAVYPDPNLEGHPEWAYLFPVSDEALNALEKYMTEFAKFANGRVGAVEVWNEYNNMSGPYKLQYQYFVNLHKPIWKGVKKGDPNLAVSGIDTDTWGVLIHKELEKTLDLMDGNQYFDQISIHPYHMTQGKPEVGASVESCVDETKRQLEKHGYDPNMQFHFSEIGWSEAKAGSKEKQAAYTIRNQAYSYSYVPGVKVYTYCLHDYPEYNSIPKNIEAEFGITESYSPEGAEVPCLGKDAFAAAGYFNNLMAEHKSFKNILTELGLKSEEAFAYRVKSRNDEDILMIGAVDETAQEFNLNLGCESVVVGDIFGNEKTVYGKNGNYSFYAKPDEITYIKGSFGEIKQGEKQFLIDEEEKTVPIDYNFNIEVTVPNGFMGKAYLSGQNVEISKNEVDITSTKTKLAFKSLNKITDNAFINLIVKDENGNIYFERTVPVTYSTSAIVTNVKWRTIGGRTDLWELQMDLKNIRGDKAVHGRVNSDFGKSFVVPSIAPGETRKVSVPVGKLKDISELGKFNGFIDLSTTDKIPVNINDTMTGVVYANKKPKIDGIISKNEWDVGVLELKINSINQVYGPNKATWTGPLDASMKVYAKYDEENFYICAEVTDDVYRQINGIDKLWNGDSLQFLLGFNKDLSGTQYGIGLVEGGNTPGVYRNMQEGNFGGWEGKDAQGVYTDADVAIKRNGKTTVYEAAFPWSTIMLEPITILPGQVIYFSVLYNDDDGKNRENWIEYANNCIGSGSNGNSQAVEAVLLPNK